MGTSHTIWKQVKENGKGFEFNIDEHSNLFDLSIGGYDEGCNASVEICELNTNDLQTVCIGMMKILSYYVDDPKLVLQKLIEEVPEFDSNGVSRMNCLFRQLRNEWFNEKLKNYSHERESEDEDQEEKRNKENNEMKKEFDKQTEKLINGGLMSLIPAIAPQCANDL